MWGRSAGDEVAALAGMALDFDADRWRQIAEPPVPTHNGAAGGALSGVWNGSRVLLWATGGGGHTAGLWAYDPSGDEWEQAADIPAVAVAPALAWGETALYATGGSGTALERTLYLELGPDGTGFPGPLGTEVVTYAHPALPFELLAVADNGRAAIVSFATDRATVYEAADNLLPSAPVESAVAVGDGWVVATSAGVYWYPDGITTLPGSSMCRSASRGHSPCGCWPRTAPVRPTVSGWCTPAQGGSSHLRRSGRSRSGTAPSSRRARWPRR